MDITEGFIEGSRAVIQLTIPDSQHISGGPFCCFIKVIPVYPEESKGKSTVVIDFITLNVYGIAKFDKKIMRESKLQGNLHFPFLREEQKYLKHGQGIFLIFSSDPMVFCTCTEITDALEELHFRFLCTIPPFLPPTIEGKNISCKYYVFISVQYRDNSGCDRSKTLSKKLEFNVLGSVYPGPPVLNSMFYPFLPKTSGIKLMKGIPQEKDIAKKCLEILSKKPNVDNMHFDYESKLECLKKNLPQESFSSVITSDSSHDLDRLWSTWDSLLHLGPTHTISSINTLYCFKLFTETFSDLMKDDPIGHNMESLKSWFENILSIDSPTSDADGSEKARDLALDSFIRELETRTHSLCNTSVEEIGGILSQSLDTTRNYASSDVSLKSLSFSCDGSRLCTCSLRGFDQIKGLDEFTLAANSWFTLTFDFTAAECSCLQIDVSLIRVDIAGNYSAKTSENRIIQRSLCTFGKSSTGLTLLVPLHFTPSFASNFLRITYRLEILFYCLAKSVDLLGFDPAKFELKKLKTVKWNKPIRLLQCESLRVHTKRLDLHHEGSKESSEYLGQMSHQKMINPAIFHGKPMQNYTTLVI